MPNRVDLSVACLFSGTPRHARADKAPNRAVFALIQTQQHPRTFLSLGAQVSSSKGDSLPWVFECYRLNRLGNSLAA